jgi:hypothetical protein
MPPTSLYIVQSNPVPGREGEFGDWYARHLRETLLVPGWASAQRFAPGPGGGGGGAGAPPPPPPYPYAHLAIYEISGDPVAAFHALARARQDGMVTPSSPVSADLAACLFQPVSERLVAPPDQ